MNANDVWKHHQVANGHVQFFASVMVLQYLAVHYHTARTHQARVLAILAARQHPKTGESP